MPSTNAKAIPMVSFNTTGLTTAYQAIDPAGLPNACAYIKIINNSNVDILVSYDGSTDNDFVPANFTTPFMVQEMKMPKDQLSMFSKGTIFSIKNPETPPTGTGLIYIVGYHL